MDFRYSAEDEAFRREFRLWLERNLEYATPPRGPLADEEEGSWEATLRWHRRLYEGGWLGITWPAEYGGRGGTFLQETIVDQELEQAGSGLPFTGPGIWLLGPTLIHWGTATQKQRHLRKILAGEEMWCQGYSEPNAGSDLAAIQTRAVEHDGYFVVNGSKIWTSLAHHSHWMFLLARTDSAAPKHKGISYLLVEMKTPGITISPLIQMTGARHFNQVFLEDVRVPIANIVGERNQGWQVALTTLAFERSSGQERIMTNRVRELAQLASQLSRNGRALAEDASVRQTIGQFAAEAAAIRYTGFRQLTRQLKGLPPGPEGSSIKLSASELGLRIASFALEMLGAYGQLERGDQFAAAQGLWTHRMLEARGPMIYSGANEIQRNILGERVLGLPKG
ncbi:MAG TPA: acyl-CoA dehydrogenase family protein [Candidatus Binataceae bacterium]|nr:acyl-CoA dehydrogenase family protein [Candidatus Binataceae bacterium]